jgi:linoleoyl-CoA desaturase
MKFAKKNTNDFFITLNKKVDDYFLTKNCDRHANAEVVIKGIVLVATYIGCYALLVSGIIGTALSILLLVVMGFSGVMIVFNIVHDASHKSLFKKRAHNKAAAYLGDLVGMNTYIWDIRHNMQHHSFTNIVGGDILLDKIPLMRVSPYQPRLAIHKYQTWYVPFLYMIYSIFWVFFLDISFFFRKNMANFKNIRHPRAEWIKLILFKTFYLVYMILLPWLVFDISLGTVMLAFLIYHVAAGLMLSLVVVLGHCVEGPAYIAPDENGLIDNSWVQHEWDTTSDFATSSRLALWVTGGLNTHLAHHLYPKICHCHYYDITKIIKQHCEEYEVPYPGHSFVKAIQSHFKFLQIQARA